jgi:hypothetical protein
VARETHGSSPPQENVSASTGWRNPKPLSPEERKKAERQARTRRSNKTAGGRQLTVTDRELNRRREKPTAAPDLEAEYSMEWGSWGKART